MLTIFEGPDGTGKTTAAKIMAERTKSAYVHFGAETTAVDYLKAMAPVLRRVQNAVFDRSWLSERPYGKAFHGRDRLGDDARYALEQLAMRCKAVVVKSTLPWQVVRTNWESRGAKVEMLRETEQLYHVYELYEAEPTDLPTVGYDYRAMDHQALYEKVAHMRVNFYEHRALSQVEA